MLRSILAAGLTSICLGATGLSAQTVLTMDQVISRARDQAGAVAVARARIAEAEAALLDASPRFRENPVIEAALGPRMGGGDRTTDVDVGMSQRFETGGQRSARIDVARAGIDRHRAEADAVAREAVFEAASAFLRGVAAAERMRIAGESDAVSRELLAATDRRHSAGDVPAIDLNLARIDAARSAAALRAARIDLMEAVSLLRVILRAPASEPIELQGSLDVASAAPLDSLRAAVEGRPVFAALEASAREAEAHVRLGRALGRPDVGFRVGYAREASDTVVLGGLSIVLPAFQRAQGALAAGLARSTRVRLELETTRERALAELRAAYAAYEQRLQLSEALTKDALASVADNESLARRSYDAGEMNLMELLLVRRDALATRTELIARRLDTALSRLTVDYVAGVLQ